MKRSTFTILLYLGGIISLSAQQNIVWKRCATNHDHATHEFEEWLNSKKEFAIAGENEVLRIPVVMHILHQGEPLGEGTNMSNEQVLSQLAVINQDFRRKEGSRGYNNPPCRRRCQHRICAGRKGP